MIEIEVIKKTLKLLSISVITGILLLRTLSCITEKHKLVRFRLCHLCRDKIQW